MNIRITTTNIRYGAGDTVEGVTVHFTARDDRESLSLTGAFEFDATEYEGNESVANLRELVRTRAVDIIEGNATGGATVTE